MNTEDIRPIDILVDAMNIPVDENGIKPYYLIPCFPGIQGASQLEQV